MKKLPVLICLLILVISSVYSQYGYVPEVISGNLNYRELTNPANSTLIGVGLTQVGASDFDLNKDLYAISGNDNGLYKVSTEDASATLIGNVPSPASEFWSGMACDPVDGTMYICSTNGSTNSFYTIDVTTAEVELIGTNTESDGVVGIAFDDNGQMYAIYLVRKFYQIDKTNANATFIGDLNAAVPGFPHHGLDFNPESQTMYMVSYNAFTFDNEMWSVDLATGNNTLVGSVGLWTGTIAVEPDDDLLAGFSVDINVVCEGGLVNFTDESIGNPDSWLWYFEGGTPETSFEQNPQVIYETTGVFDVSLEVATGSSTNTLLEEGFITVKINPEPVINGPVEVCQGYTYEYSTIENIGSSYQWEVDGGDIISGNGTHLINIEWIVWGEGSVNLTEEDLNGCVGVVEQLDVNISVCNDVENYLADNASIYPNPVSNTLCIRYLFPGKAKFIISDNLGRTLYSTEKKISGDGKYTLDVAFLEPGKYILHMVHDDQSIGIKWFVKVK